jgi:hypothetical protein
VLHVSVACKVFLDYPQNYQVCWRGSHPSPVRVSDKQNVQKNLRKLGLDKLDDQKLVDATTRTKRKLKITQKAIKDRILITCSLAMAPEKGAC